MSDNVEKICVTIVICVIVIVLGFLVHGCDLSYDSYMGNINKINDMKINDVDKADIMKKLTDDYTARKKK